MKNKSAKKWLGVAVGSAIAMSASVAQAALFAETESNDTFATANAFSPFSNSPWGAIGNASAASNDVDIWSFTLDANQSIAAEIAYIGEYNKFDVNPVMTLFWENAGSYYPVASASSSIPSFAASTGTSSLAFTAWSTGNYFLALSADFNQGVDAFGNFATTAGFLTTEDVLGTAFDHFNGGSFTSFKYDVTTATTVVPVPAAVWLFGSGLLGLVGAARRSHKA